MLEKYFPQKYHKPTYILVGAAVIVFIFGRIFGALTSDRVDRGEASVLVQAIPFASTFIAIILLYALSMFIVALRYNGKIPYRTHRPIELTCIAGIGFGVFAIFQPWEISSYKYGFLLLLGSTIAFILWSHVRPQSAAMGRKLPPFTITHQAVGVVLAVIFLLVMVWFATSTISEPEAPYGLAPRTWRFYESSREEEVPAIIAKAEHDYDYEIYSIALMSLLPAAILYFIGREAAAGYVDRPDKHETYQVPHAVPVHGDT